MNAGRGGSKFLIKNHSWCPPLLDVASDRWMYSCPFPDHSLKLTPPYTTMVPSSIFGNTARVIAVELLCGVQGVEQRRPRRPGQGTRRICDAIRGVIPPLDSDRSVGPEIETVAAMIENGDIDQAADWLPNG